MRNSDRKIHFAGSVTLTLARACKSISVYARLGWLGICWITLVFGLINPWFDSWKFKLIAPFRNNRRR